MAQKFPFSMWNYKPLNESRVSDVDDWAECGFTVPMSPAFLYGKDDPCELIPYLDRAHEKNMQLLINLWNVSFKNYVEEGAKEYERKLREVHECLKGHPALYGYVVGDEPTGAELDASIQCVKIQKEMDPTLNPYLNFSGTHTVARLNDYYGECSYPQWLTDGAKEAGHYIYGFDEYSQAINNLGGYNAYFRTTKDHMDAADAAGADMWACLLLSAHHVFNKPTELQIKWQINISAALGCRGVSWFRFYDRTAGHDLYGSPVDEYGFKTDTYYNLLRCQRRFNDHYGEILMRLKRKNTWIIGNPRGDYPNFKPGDYEYILSATADDTGVLSVFEDENGTEYVCIVNGCDKYFQTFHINFDSSKCTFTELTQNGRVELDFDEMLHGDGISLQAAQMRLLRINKI